jgi:peptidoglycan/xylan/chitin deacetylase (PgdA/CDA1 family)
MARKNRWLALAPIAWLAWTCPLAFASAPVAGCAKPVYLTLDTGGMQSAELIAGILKKHDVKATFFLANEKTFRGDYALDDSWAAYWQARVAEGHAFGTHTWRHGRILKSADGAIRYRPQFGESSGRTMSLSHADFCTELTRVGAQFERLTQRRLDPIWRAPGGYTTPESISAAKACGFAHVHWSSAGFLGDELSSDTHPNQALLNKALSTIRSGDVLMAHLGIWSRKEVYAPMLDPLISGLKAKGFCFATVTAAGPDARIPR